VFSTLVALSLAAAPELVVLSSHADVGELRFQPLGNSALVEPAVRFSHGDGSPVLGSVLPNTRVVVAAVAMRSTGDLSFVGALLRLEAGKSARVLADQLVYGSRPFVTTEGRVFISRGRAGEPTLDTMRVDALTVEEIDPTTAKTRLVFSAQGFETHVVGALGRELIIYEVTPSGARLLAVHVDTLGVRVVVRALVPMARDFVIDAPRKRVLFTQVQADGWYVEQVSLVDGARRSLAEGPEVTLLPTVLTDGRVLISAGEGRGLRALDGKEGLAAQGPGFERVRFEGHGLLVGLHEVPSEFPSLFVFQKGVRVPIAMPPESRLDVAGVIP
jgi:hypothetical protein